MCVKKNFLISGIDRNVRKTSKSQVQTETRLRKTRSLNLSFEPEITPMQAQYQEGFKIQFVADAGDASTRMIIN